MRFHRVLQKARALAWSGALVGGVWLGMSAAWAQRVLPQPPEIAATSYVLFDVTTGTFLASHQANTRIDPAALTHLMTAYVVFDAIRGGHITLQQPLEVSAAAAQMPGLRMFIEADARVPVQDLLTGLLVQSGNDAAVALAQGVAGSVTSFVERMNRQARVLGMGQTQFLNPEGSPTAGHHSTAGDMAVLALRLLSDFPEHAHLFAIQRYRFGNTPAANDANRNLLLFRDPTVDGLKAAYSAASGYSLVGSAQRHFESLGQGPAGQRRLVSVVVGARGENARAAESQKLLNWGFTAIDVVRLFAPGQSVAEPPIWKGRAARVKLGLPQGVLINVPAGQSLHALRSDVLRQDPLVAPFEAGQSVGFLRVSNAHQVIAEIPLQVLEPVREAGAWGRFWGALRLWLL